MHDASILQRVERAAALGDLLLFGRESRQFFITSWLLLHGNMGSIFARCYNKWPLRPQTKKSNRNFTVTGMSMSCLDRARTAIQILDTTTLFFACMMQAYCRESSVLLLSGTSSFLVGNLDNSSLLRGFCYMETWGRFLQDATTNGL